MYIRLQDPHQLAVEGANVRNQCVGDGVTDRTRTSGVASHRVNQRTLAALRGHHQIAGGARRLVETGFDE